MKKLKNKLSYAIYIVLGVVTGCDYTPEYTMSNESVIAKTYKEFENKETIYRIAFSSGFDRKVSFGDYSRLNIGDSVEIKYYNGFTTFE